MAQQEGRLLYGPGGRYTLHGITFREDNPLDILVGNTRVSGHVHYEASDGNWYCDAGLMSIPLYDGREARFRLEMVRYKQGDEDDLMLAALGDLGELYVEDDWDGGFEDEQRYEQACSQEGAKHENI
jgi:hypothetical protein